MNTSHPTPQTMIPPVSPVSPNHWIPMQWVPSPNPMNPMFPMRPMTRLGPLRPRRPASGPMFSRAGSRMWRGNRFKGTKQEAYTPRKFYQKFQNNQEKTREEPVSSGPSPESIKPKESPTEEMKASPDTPIKTETPRTNGQHGEGKKKKKKKKISTSVCYPLKFWNRQDAEKAITAELEVFKENVKTLIIKFPDPEVSWHLIKSMHSSIEKVHFLVPTTPRSCFIQISENADVDEVIEDLNKIDFYNLGKIKAERKFAKPNINRNPEAIDPYTLYVGNLPIDATPSLIKEKFPTAARIDVGFAHKMKFTRYAFIRYQTVEESIEAFRSSCNLVVDSRNLIVRFRRVGGKNSSPDSGTSLARREKRKLLERNQELNDWKRLVAKKMKKEDGELSDDGTRTPTLEEIIGSKTDAVDDQDSDEEEKEVDDDDDEDDDDIEEMNSEDQNHKEEEDDEEEEDEEEDDDDDEEEDDYEKVEIKKEKDDDYDYEEHSSDAKGEKEIVKDESSCDNREDKDLDECDLERMRLRARTRAR